MIRRIRALVHQQGFTLAGARVRIQEEDAARVEAALMIPKGWRFAKCPRFEQVRRLARLGRCILTLTGRV